MDNEERVLAAVRLGALGYFPKTSARADLLEAIRNVAQGTPYLPPEIALKLMNSLRHQPAAAPTATPVDSITGRQKEILDLLAQGQSDADISQKLHLEESTVRSHIYHMLQRLELETRAQLVAYAYQSRKTR